MMRRLAHGPGPQPRRGDSGRTRQARVATPRAGPASATGADAYSRRFLPERRRIRAGTRHRVAAPGWRGHTERVNPLATLDLGSEPVVVRRATGHDVPAIVALLRADDLGATRDGIRCEADRAAYQRAFADIDRDPAQVLVVAESGGQVVATLQLSFIPGLSRRGALRAQIESVRVAAAYRNRGLGQALFTWAIGEARRRGCAQVNRACPRPRFR